MDTAEFSKLAGMLCIALSQNHLLGFEITQLSNYWYFNIENINIMKYKLFLNPLLFNQLYAEISEKCIG